MSRAVPTLSAAAPAVRGRPFARVVLQRDAPPCSVEVELLQRGARVTRLLAEALMAGQAVDVSTLRLLGKLYDGLIVPHAEGFSAAGFAAASGVPVVFDDEDLSAFNA